jgi:predicted deacylase
MLAALRQSEVADFHSDGHGHTIFDYAIEVERLRREEREADAMSQF